MTAKLIVTLMLALLLAGCNGPSPQKIAALQAECSGATTPVAHAQCLNDVERREMPDPYPELANIVYAARVNLAQKVEAKQMTPEAAEFEFSKIVAQVHDEERQRTAAAVSSFGQGLQNAGRALQSVQ